MRDFFDPAMQAAYEDATRQVQYDRLRFLYAAAGTLCLAYLLPDYLLHGGTPVWEEMRFWRLLVVGLTLMAYGLNHFRILKGAPKYPLPIAFGAAVFIMFVVARIAHAAGGFDSFYFPPVDIVFIVWGFFFVGGKRRLGLPAAVLLVVFLLVMGALDGGFPPAREFLGRSLLLAVPCLLCVWGGEVIEDLRRKEFARSWETVRRQKELESALADQSRTQERLLQLEGLATIGEYLAGILHDLRNPVAGVRSVVEEVVRELKGAGPGSLEGSIQSLESSLRQQQRAEQFIRALLVLSRRTQGYGEKVEVNEAVGAVLQILRVQFKREPVEYAGQYGLSLPPIRGNFAQLGQVLLNVGRNAAEALSGAGGRIVFETRAEGGWVEILCRDTGPGFAPEALPHVFDLFFSTKATKGGSGLGLFLAHEIIGRHGGDIRAENLPGGGAQVTVRLPAFSGDED